MDVVERELAVLGYEAAEAREHSALLATHKQVQVLQILFRDCLPGLKQQGTRDQRLTVMRQLVQRSPDEPSVESFNDLLVGEASALISWFLEAGTTLEDKRLRAGARKTLEVLYG